jgi:two-component system, chemotaxis family, chemotaxis protein CheY
MPKVVVIVEDSETVALSLALAVESIPGVAAVIAHDAMTALNLFRRPGESIAAVVTDLNLPEVDGFELIKQIRGLAGYASLPAIMITADERAGLTSIPSNSCPNALFRKPFSTRDVCHALQEMLE